MFVDMGWGGCWWKDYWLCWFMLYHFLSCRVEIFMEVDIYRSRFCMEVRMDNLNKFWENSGKQNGRQITKLSINSSFLELQSPNSARKFVWTVWTNFDKILKNKMAAKKQNGPQITKLSWNEQGRLLSSRVRFFSIKWEFFRLIYCTKGDFLYFFYIFASFYILNW